VFSASDVNDTNGTINITAAPYAAGKNKIINGDFRINQRAFTSTTTALTYGFDRWRINNAGSFTATYSAQTFIPGTAPVSGYEGINFARVASTANSGAGDYCVFAQLMEDVRTCAGQTVTVSFWAKAASGTPKVGVELAQNFGSGGSLQVNGTGQAVTISTSWARYSVTIAVPSVSGKTIGTGSYIELNLWTVSGSTYATRSGSVGNQTATIDFWGVQVEQGSTATAFQTATGIIQGELAACYRYFQRIQDPGGIDGYVCTALAYGSTAAYGVMQFIAPFRSNPTTTFTSGDYEVLQANATIASLSSMIVATPTTTTQLIGGTTTGLTSGQALLMRSGTASFVLDLSAEL
jgi:hypothetical protein